MYISFELQCEPNIVQLLWASILGLSEPKLTLTRAIRLLGSRLAVVWLSWQFYGRSQAWFWLCQVRHFYTGGRVLIGWKKQPVNQVPSTEWTVIYSKVVILCSCHSFSKPVKNPVLCSTMLLYICTRYLDIWMCYLDVAKGSQIIISVIKCLNVSVLS